MKNVPFLTKLIVEPESSFRSPVRTKIPGVPRLTASLITTTKQFATNICNVTAVVPSSCPVLIPSSSSLPWVPASGRKVPAKLQGYVNRERKLELDGFTCPGNSEVRGPQNLVQAHPTYPHPTDCQYYFVRYHNKEPNKFGCPDGQVFDSEIQVCKKPEEVPECSCWY